MENTLALIGFIVLVIVGGMLYDLIKGQGEFDPNNRKLKEIKDEIGKIKEKLQEGK